ncbi:hypothetical protein LPH44_05675 [Xylella taiwanensis]|uniref:hypothetical protein n=1 Tax=Xylella taiwanensis TaxID=1444770 RepID=UPI0004B56784|nr:hypothetical protein [Xylella taiwanensis]MCD8456518.1 hypothetical protein [Xylella taiwanensis]MCD8465568.1 hypothetical protein [Xylella taiwanensis]UFN12297.1 hypothetical protein LPH44_05675 [Xylella taiwanensis]UFN21381.1 hypothetical protein LPH58_05655 [Xylella taiwanensis]UFN41221.1 hypothetical protein LPH57_11455 [Xylella taiwanensis]
MQRPAWRGHRIRLLAVHEFGAPERGIPERSVVLRSIRQYQEKYGALNRQHIRAMLHGEMTAETTLNRLGTLSGDDPPCRSDTIGSADDPAQGVQRLADRHRTADSVDHP